MAETIADQIDKLLPQTQCRRCGYKDCRAYAEAVAFDGTAFNRCAPGGARTVAAIATLLNRSNIALDAHFGNEETEPLAAYIQESKCIGCYKCAAICPVDAIIGAPKRMHTVIESECTGCGLCLPVCPVDCIHLRRRSVDNLLARDRAENSRRRYYARRERVKRRMLKLNAARDRLTEKEREACIQRYLQAARSQAREENDNCP